MRRWARALVALAAACSGEETLPPDPGLPLTVSGVEPRLVLPNTVLQVKGQNFLDGRDETKLVFEGTMTPEGGGVPAEVYVELKANVASPTALVVKMTPTILTDGEVGFGGYGDFAGTVKAIQRKGTELREATAQVSLKLQRTVKPALDPPGTLVLFFGDVASLAGTGLLFGDEGATALRFLGIFERDEGGSDAVDVVLPTTGVSRTQVQYTHGLDAFGPKPGRFFGTITPVNVFESETLVGDRVVAEIYSVVPLIAALVPAGPNGTVASGASRGQKIYFDGGGFVEDDTRGESTTVRLDGTFAKAGGGSTVIHTELATRLVRPGRLVWTLQLSTPPGGGPFPGPGTFTGTAKPVVYRGTTVVEGSATGVTLHVRPDKQVVFLKYLANFADALRAPLATGKDNDRVFGLYNAQDRIKQGILAKVRKDYCYPVPCGEISIAVDVRDERPDDFTEYMVVELAGVDPNGADLLGYDNSADGGKDVGNLHLDDVIGGAGAADEGGAFRYGGVFLKSFMRMSPTYNAKYYAGQGGSQSAQFDAIFGPFSLEISSSAAEVTADEARLPCPPPSSAPTRHKQVCEAIRVLSNLVGNTLTHEIGHALGLASDAGAGEDPYHNPGDGNWTMDPGSARPFEERAELPGATPAVWHPADLEYLMAILPGGK